MGIRSAPRAAHLTLAGTTVLHAFTHAYATMFHPLYLLMRIDLDLSALSRVTLLVTLYGVVYWGLSYPAGLLADRYDRRLLLTIGLIGNAAAITALAFTGWYPMVVALCVVAGIFGSLFHPCANALVPAHYPKAPGMAIGLLGVGSGIGFASGPFLSGFIAGHSTLAPAIFAAWQRPFVYMGVAGLVVAVVYYCIAREAPQHSATARPAISPALRRDTLIHAVLIALREFAIVGSITLAALYLLNSLHFNTQRTGRILGLAMIFAAFVNPVLVYLTAGVRRLPWHVGVLLLAAVVLVLVPFVPPDYVIYPLIVFQTLGLASSAIGDAGLTERLDPRTRGRINGMFLTIVGTSAATSPLFVGFALDLLGGSAATSGAYVLLFVVLTLLVLAATASAASLARLGRTAAADAPPPSVRPAAEPVLS